MTTMEQTLTVRVPFVVRRRGGRKLVLAPDGTMTDPGRPRVDNTMVKAIARAFRWRKLMETGVYGTVEEIAAAEKINASYVSRVLRLTLLAPEIVEPILAGRQPEGVTLAELMGALPMEWARQSKADFEFLPVHSEVSNCKICVYMDNLPTAIWASRQI